MISWALFDAIAKKQKKDVVRQKDVHVAVPDLNVLAVVEIAKVIIVTTAFDNDDDDDDDDDDDGGDEHDEDKLSDYHFI